MAQCYRYVFTLNEQADVKIDAGTICGLKAALKEHAKKWIFQHEKGEEGRDHLQGRVSFIKKLRHKDVVKLIRREWNIYWAVERDEERSGFYACKEDTRVAGPWSDRDRAVYIPRQLRGIELQGWQAELRGDLKKWDSRSIHFVVDKNGGIGKSTFVTYMCIKEENCFAIPNTCQTADDMMQYACKIVGDAKENVVFMLDVPRSVVDKSWGKWLSCLEALKNGHLYDHRYTATVKWIDCPGICVFANELPPDDMLTSDRWKKVFPQRFDGGALPAVPARDIPIHYEELSD